MKYIVIDTDQENFESGRVFKTESAYGAEDAVEEYVRYQEGKGLFSDGYPNGRSIYKTKDDEGNIQTFTVETNFIPSYWIMEHDG